MKKIIALLLGLILTLSLLFLSFESPFEQAQPTVAPTVPTQPTGTAPTAPPTVPPTDPTTGTDAPTVPPVTEPVVYDLPTSAIILTEQVEQTRDGDGHVYFTYLYPNVRLYLGNETVSQKVTLDLLNLIDITRTRAYAVRDDAANSGTAGSFYQVQYTPQRIDGAVLSLSGNFTSFTGGAHPETTCNGVTYDLMTGNAITLRDVLTDACTADVLCRMVVDVLNSMKEDTILYADFSLSVEDRFSGNYLADEGWYLSSEGLCFTFEPYEVGPYSSGIITAVIPYSMLPGYLNDAYFPMERVHAQGDLLMTSWEDSNLDPLTDTIEINLIPNSEAIVLHTQGLLYDLIIQTDTVDPTVLFAADQLTSGTAIILRPGTNKLRIHYSIGDQIYSQSIIVP